MATDKDLLIEAYDTILQKAAPLKESRPSAQNMKVALKNIIGASIDNSPLLMKLWVAREHIEREINSQFRDEAAFADWVADYMMSAIEDLEEEFGIYDLDDEL